VHFPTHAALGKAAEYFFAYRVSHTLGWPCRLFDVDIGIDGQVEILDSLGMSTGRFIAFQVKTQTRGAAEGYCDVTARHITYWQSVDTPVFVALVDLKRKAIFLHEIERGRKYAKPGKQSTRLHFDPSASRFGKATATLFADAANRAAIAQVTKHLRRVACGVERVKAVLDQRETLDDAPTLVDLVHQRHAWRKSLSEAWAVANALRAGKEDCSEAEDRLERTLSDLRDLFDDYELDRDWDGQHDGNGEIRRFLEEAR